MKRQKMLNPLWGVILLMVTAGGCGKKEAPFDVAAYRQETEQWQKTRQERLQRPNGWLTLCGLSWLVEGENRVGSDTGDMVRLPAGRAPAYLGSIFQKNGTFTFLAARGADIRWKDSAITRIQLHHDQEPGYDPTILSTGSLSFYVIKRGEQYGVRIKDTNNPARVNFKGLEFFPIDPSLRLEAAFEPYTPPKVLQIASVIGTTESDSCPGALVFDINGTQYRLDAVIETPGDTQLFIMFKDATAGKETYANGRQLYTSLPDADHRVILDFNKAFNWPCVFTDFATCPIPPPQNTLPIRIEAGEKMYRGHSSDLASDVR